MDEQERRRRDIVIDELLDNEKTRDLAFNLAIQAREVDDPEILEMDVTAAEKYARVCLIRMPPSNFNRVTTRDIAGLWGRGALGAARYRRSKRKKA